MKQDSKISEHFRKLGHKSWAARKKRILQGEKLDKRAKKLPK